MFSFAFPKRFLLSSSVYGYSCHISLAPPRETEGKYTHSLVSSEEFSNELLGKLGEGLGKPQRNSSVLQGLRGLVAIISLKEWREEENQGETGRLCEIDLPTGSLALSKLWCSPWQPHSDGNKCHTLHGFSLLVCNTVKPSCESVGKGAQWYAEEFNLPGYSRVDKSGEWT